MAEESIHFNILYNTNNIIIGPRTIVQLENFCF